MEFHLLGIGIVIHCIFIASILDIYFESPIINVKRQFRVEIPRPAKRVVLFLCDGLRAQSLYNVTDRSALPLRTDMGVDFLRSVMAEKKASWGISYTQAPTENRPGQTALLSGVYEDPQSIMSGFQINPVQMDSVLNQSRYVWCWGTTKTCKEYSTVGDQMFQVAYSDEQLSSAYSNYLNFDAWLANNVIEFLRSSAKDPSLITKLHEDQIIFFVYFIGTDEAGHDYKPNSKGFDKFLGNIDRSVAQIVHSMDAFFAHDNATAYIFTSDHGMLDTGEHGGSSPPETQTPLIAWGAGVNNTPSPADSDGIRPRGDVHQADISVLLSVLLGTAFPKHSMGSVPEYFLNMSQAELSEVFYTNMRQRLELFKMAKQEKSISFRFKPFNPLNEDVLNNDLLIIDELIIQKNYQEAIEACKHLMSLSLQGIDYYRNYNQRLLLTTILLSMVLWFLILLENVLRDNLIYIYEPNLTVVDLYCVNGLYLLMGMCIALTSFLVYESRLPIRHVVYFILPELLLCHLISNYKTWLAAAFTMWKASLAVNLLRSVQIFGYFFAVEMLVVAFVVRYMFAAVTLGVGVWLLLCNVDALWDVRTVSWSISVLLVAIFPLMPAISDRMLPLVLTLGGFAWIMTAIWIMYYMWEWNKPEAESSPDSVTLVKIQLVLITLSVCLALIIRTETIAIKYYFFLRITAWYILGFSVLMLLFSSLSLVKRLCHLLLMLAVPTLLMSVAQEPLFLLVLGTNMFQWVWTELRVWNLRQTRLEERGARPEVSIQRQIAFFSFGTFQDICKPRSRTRNINCGDFRRAYFYLFYLLLAFYGTATTETYAYFKSVWSDCLVCDMQSYLIAVFSVCKVFTLLMVPVAFIRAVNLVTHAPLRKLLFILWMYLDLMGVHLICLVRAQGPWMDVGVSVANFVFSQVCVLLVLLLYGLAVVLTSARISLNNQLDIIRKEFVDK